VRNPTKFSTKALSIPGFEALFNKNGAAAKLSFCNSPFFVFSAFFGAVWYNSRKLSFCFIFMKFCPLRRRFAAWAKKDGVDFYAVRFYPSGGAFARAARGRLPL
jgi:hypothetical protein